MIDALGFDFDAAVQAPHRMQPGLRRLAAGQCQLTPSVAPQRGTARHLREKLAVLWAYPQQALCCVPGFDAAPALAALSAHAATEHPEAWVANDDGGCEARWLGWRLDAQLEPHAAPDGGWPEIGALLHATPAHWRLTVLLSLAFAEDFAIVDAASGTLPWLAVALPSMWAPEAKLGLAFAEIHAAVADNDRVVAAAQPLLNLVTGTQRWERFVWTLTGHPRLHAHPQRMPVPRWPSGLDGEGLTGDTLARLTWWRTERQTFIPVPAQRQAVFTIAVNTQRLPEAISSPGQAQAVHDALASISDAVLDYRGLATVRAPLLAWLAARAAA